MAVRLSISNIAWSRKRDKTVYELMQKYGFEGLEIAPTRIIPENPYEYPDEARQWADMLKQEYNFEVSSMQSIWYGRTERIFGNAKEREILLAYTKKAIEFAERTGCRNLVFGCPRNRDLRENEDKNIAVPFFKELGEYAFMHNTVLAMEANPPIYQTNYINDTMSAIELVKRVNSKGFMLNLDVGTMVQNGEPVSQLEGNAEYINHVHISEPGLALIRKRELHSELISFLKNYNYEKYISIEMGRQDDGCAFENVMDYVRNLTERE